MVVQSAWWDGGMRKWEDGEGDDGEEVVGSGDVQAIYGQWKKDLTNAEKKAPGWSVRMGRRVQVQKQNPCKECPGETDERRLVGTE